MALLDSLIIAALVLLWGWVLGKPLVVNRLGSWRRGGVGSFHRGLRVLTRSQRLAGAGDTERYRHHLASRRQAARRRQVFLALVISVVVSLVLALALGDVFVTLHLTMDALLVGFVTLAVCRVADRSGVEPRWCRCVARRRRDPSATPRRPARSEPAGCVAAPGPGGMLRPPRGCSSVG
jgi:hypothetical protein